ncbi:DUF2141 domain-containing protein [Azospirillum sp. TSA2s]|uniref:DUF2141 domain-containing protein n=1 Tax=Azospirillum sp. TSA2s TaxID=709810 RepID=UPI0035288C18
MRCVPATTRTETTSSTAICWAIPLEGDGFGNDPRIMLAPPSFADASITVGEGGAETGLTLRY